MSKLQRNLIREFAEDAAGRIARRAIRHLKQSKATLSGDDSGLRSSWAEICVQVQGEESYFWDAYVDLMHGCVLGQLQALSQCELVALWLQTSEGWDWHWDVQNVGLDGNAPDPDLSLADVPVDSDEIARFLLKEQLLPAAEREQDQAVSSFLAARYEHDGLESAGEWAEASDDMSPGPEAEARSETESAVQGELQLDETAADPSTSSRRS